MNDAEVDRSKIEVHRSISKVAVVIDIEVKCFSRACIRRMLAWNPVELFRDDLEGLLDDFHVQI